MQTTELCIEVLSCCDADHTGQAGCPAFIKQSQEGLQTWQYVMPANPVEPNACPTGFGSGINSGRKGISSVVAVVGSAHVRGIVSQLQHIQAKSGRQ